MTSRQPARRTIYRTRIRWVRVAGLFVVVWAIVAALGSESLVPSTVRMPSSAWTATPVDHPRDEQRDGLGEAGGAIPDGTTVFDDEVPGVAKLDSAVLAALRQAATDAAGDGVEFVVDSGWRSPAYQEQLLQGAVRKYGSEAEAARWVATPDTSAHVSGDAVDIGPSRAAAWLSEHGAAYGLCQIYGNEPWHFELRTAAGDQGCPAVYADPTHDPRMQ